MIPSSDDIKANMNNNIKKKKKMYASSPVHVNCNLSLLDSDAKEVDFRGLYNLGAITLVVMNARLVIENILKYGVLLQVPSFNPRDWPKTWPCFTGIIVLAIFPLIAYFIEQLAVRIKNLTVINILHILNCLSCLLFGIAVVKLSNANVFPALSLTTCASTLFLKLISYAHVSYDIRYHMSKKKPMSNSNNDSDVINDNSTSLRKRNNKNNDNNDDNTADNNTNVDDDDKKNKLVASYRPSISQLIYFICAPTLVYQLNYPRSKRIRKRFILRRLTEFIFCIVLIIVLAEQYMLPTARNAVIYIDQHQSEKFKLFMHLFERVLKLAIPNGMLWLLGFFAFFHSYLNLVAEILRFGDRRFYLDWWNSQSLDVYWRTWNLPVHNWLVHHIYAPARRRKLSRIASMGLVFLFSAVMHEILVSIPCHLGHFYAFAAMMAQIPLIIITKIVVRNTRGVYGNITFWTSFLVFGQPLAVLLYYTSFVQERVF